MKATVDQNSCIGCGLCVDICPAVFTMQGEVAEVIADPVPEAEEANCREACESCPVSAITLS